MISVRCTVCDSELIAPGAILFGIPTYSVAGSDEVTCLKEHLCIDCYELTRMILRQVRRRMVRVPT